MRLASVWKAAWLLCASLLFASLAYGEPAVQSGCLGSAASTVPDATALLGRPFDVSMPSEDSIEVAFSSGETDGAIQVCTIPPQGSTSCRRVDGIWGPRFVPLGERAAAVSGLRPADSSARKAPQFDLALSVPGASGAGEGEFQTSVISGGTGPLSVFRPDGGGVFLVRGSTFIRLDEKGKEVGRKELKTPQGSWIVKPQLLTDGGDGLVVGVLRSSEGARIRAWNLGETGSSRDISDRTVPRIGDFQVVSQAGKIFGFWIERAGKTRRLMMDVSQDQGRTWGADRILVENVREITYQTQGGNGRIRLAWEVGRRFDQPFSQSLNAGEVGPEGLMSQQSILECSEDCSIVDFSLGSADAGGQLLAVSVQRSGRAHVEAYWSKGSDNQWQRIPVRDMSESGTINCLQVLGRGHRFVLMYRFQRAIRSVLQPTIPGQLCYSIIDI